MSAFKWFDNIASHLFAWSRFVIGASLLALFAATVFSGSLIFGYSLKLFAYVQQQIRNNHKIRALNGK